VVTAGARAAGGGDGRRWLPDGLRFVSGSWDKTARIAYHGLAP